MKKKLLTTAVLAGIAGTAGAVNINPDGLGQVGIYPYYTVQGGQDTYMSIVNTTDQVKAVKVRFLEALNSREVLDFNLYLSPHDVWVAAITATATGARIITPDNSCTVPAIPKPGGETFKTFQFAGANADGEITTEARTREGYIEILEMGVVTDEPTPSTFTPATFATHNSAGVPVNCAALTAAWGTGGAWAGNPARAMADPTGGLAGSEVIIDVDAATASSTNATMLDAWRTTFINTGPASILPNLASVSPATSIVFNSATPTAVTTSNWALPINAVSATMMHDNVINEFVLDNVLNAGTDWVVTFPTKTFYVQRIVAGGVVQPAIPPFTEVFGGSNIAGPVAGGACEDVTLQIYNREEQTEGTTLFSPPPPGGNALCWETNVITFNNSSLLQSALVELNVDTGFENGWMNLGLAGGGHAITSTTNQVYNGLPVIGFALTNYVNGNVGGSLANYGNLFDHRYTRSISLSIP